MPPSSNMSSATLRTIALRQRVTATSARATVALPRFNSTSTMHDNDPDLLDKEKHRNLNNTQHESSTPHKGHAPGWNEYLASASEAHVKADKDSGTMQELTERTVNQVKIRHHGEEQTVGTESVTTVDQVEGPLKTADGKK